MGTLPKSKRELSLARLFGVSGAGIRWKNRGKILIYVFKLVFLLYIWIQHPKKPLRHFDCVRLPIKLLFSMNFCRILEKLDWKNPPENPSKSRTKDNDVYRTNIDPFWRGLNFLRCVFPFKFCTLKDVPDTIFSFVDVKMCFLFFSSFQN